MVIIIFLKAMNSLNNNDVWSQPRNVHPKLQYQTRSRGFPSSFLPEEGGMQQLQHQKSRATQSIYPIAFDDVASSPEDIVGSRYEGGSRFQADRNFLSSPDDYPRSSVYGGDLGEDAIGWFQPSGVAYGDGRRRGGGREGRRVGGRGRGQGEGEEEEDVPAAIANWLLRADLDDRARQSGRRQNLVSDRNLRADYRQSVSSRRKRDASNGDGNENIARSKEESSASSETGRVASLLWKERLKFFMSKNLVADSPLAPKTGESSKSNVGGNKNNTADSSSSAIDIVFLTSWTFPDPVEKCVWRTIQKKLSSAPEVASETTTTTSSNDVDAATEACVEQLAVTGNRRPMRRRRKRSLGSDGGIGRMEEGHAVDDDDDDDVDILRFYGDQMQNQYDDNTRRSEDNIRNFKENMRTYNNYLRPYDDNMSNLDDKSLKTKTVNKRAKRGTSRRRLDDQLPSRAAVRFRNPFTLSMGELKVHRIRLRCSCSKSLDNGNGRCFDLLPIAKEKP